MRRTLYAGHLWFEATETELQKWFGQSGPVETIAICGGPEAGPTGDLPKGEGRPGDGG